MDGWSHGYDVSVAYSYGAYREMGPDWLDLCARAAGYVPRRQPGSASFRYLELGAGQGFGLFLLAAANPHAEFVGVDFQPEHIAHAEALAEAAGLTNVRFVEADFHHLARAWPADFGTFDYVALHGVYSWVPPEVRAALVECLAQATRPGSLVYNAYNTQPGWLSAMPLQHISRLMREGSGKSGSAVFDDSTRLFDRLREGGAGIFQLLPSLKARVDSVKGRSNSYLTHEFLHASWNPLWHSQVAKELAGAKLEFIGTATIAESLLPGLLPPPLRDAIVAQEGTLLRQDVQDVVINQTFRRDLFCRGPRRAFDGAPSPVTQMRLHLMAPPKPGSDVRIETSFGEIALQPQAYAEVVAALGDGAKTIGELADLPGLRQQGLANTVQILSLLLHTRTLAVGAAAPGDRARAQRANAAVARAASHGAPYDHLVTAELGSAVLVGNIDLMLLDCWLEAGGKLESAALAQGVAQRMTRLGHRLQHQGQSLDAAQAQEPLVEIARGFLDQAVPRLRRLGALV